MMELKTCAFIVTLVSLVTASPYGYGVKGGTGSATRADSSAIAGTYGGRGDIPDVPFGNGFSGSFSKSSASSSSLSSASSSSSSSSFSYSGSGAGGLSSPGANGNAGCVFGNCHNSGANQISGNHGSVGAGSGGYNLASSGAVAGSNAIAGSGANCQGSTCNNNSEKCSSGQCSSNLLTDTSFTNHDSNIKCNSGQCGAPIPTGPSASHYDNSDDIKFMAHDSKSDHGSKDLSSDYDKIPVYTGTDCRGGNCGPSATVNSPPIFSHGSNPTNYQGPANSNFGVNPGYKSPAIHLEAPKQSTGQSTPGYASGPSSYNVPIHGSYDNNKKKPSCADGKCEYPQKGSYPSATSNPLSTNYLTPQDLQTTKGPFINNPSSNCVGPSCSSGPSSTSTSGCSTPNCNPHYSASAPNGSPGKISYPEPTDKVTDGPGHTGPSGTYNSKPIYGSAPTACSSPGCTGHVTLPGANPLSTYNSVKPSASHQNLPTYTGGFGGPAGMLKPNDFTIPTSNKPILSPSSTYNIPSTTATDCKTPSCIGSSPGGDTTTQSGSYGIHKESGGVTTTYTGNFGGPSGMLKPNDFDIKVTNKPTQSVTRQPSPPSAGAIFVVNAQSGSYSATKPNAVPDTSSELPPYTGSFGGPPGFLKPSGYNSPHPSNNNPYPGPNKVTSSYGAGCTSPNCSPSIAAPPNPHSFGASQPSSVPSSITFPGYTSNYRPIGVTNPSAPAVAPISTDYTHPLHPTGHPPGTYSSGCKTGKCGAFPTGGADINIPSGSYSNSGECKTGNCDAYTPTGPDVNVPSAIPNAPSKPSAPYGNSAGCKTGNCGAYSPTGPDVNAPNPSVAPTPTGSYGDSIGCKKGNCGAYSPTGSDVNVPSANPSAPYKPSAECKTGNCGAFASTGPDVYTPPANPNVPSKPSGSYSHSVECKTGSCGAYSPTGPDVNVPSTNPNVAPKPTGSYGDSIGCKNGNCGAYPSTTGSNVNIPTGSYGNSGECKTGNCGAYPTSGSDIPTGSYGVIKPTTATKPSGFNENTPVNAQPGSYGITNPNTVPKPSNSLYTGGFGGPSGTVKPNDYILNPPSGGCKTPACTNPASVNTGAAAQSGSYAGSKPQLPAYTGGFGAPSGLLKPNEYLNPSGSPTLNKPTSSVSPATVCTYGNCNTKPLSPGHDVVLGGAHAAASSSANANAVIYTGGFGGPPGFLVPNDNGKVDLAKLVNAQNQGSHYGGANFNFPHDSKAGIHGSGTSLGDGAAGLTNSGAVSGSAGGATTYSGSVAGANSGSYGSNTHGAHQAGNAGCGGGCGSGYQGSLSSAAAGAKSLSNAGAYGGSFASSSASAHASAGAYTKGGYGKR